MVIFVPSKNETFFKDNVAFTLEAHPLFMAFDIIPVSVSISDVFCGEDKSSLDEASPGKVVYMNDSLAVADPLEYTAYLEVHIDRSPIGLVQFDRGELVNMKNVVTSIAS